MPIQCMICLSNIYPSESVGSTDCGHVFHTSCVKQWCLQSSTCPQCRAICTATNIQRLRLSTSVNNSLAVNVSRSAQLLDVANLQVRNLTPIDEANSELKEILIKKSQEMVKLSDAKVNALEIIRQNEAIKLNMAKSEINYLKMEFRRMDNLEKELKENTKELKEMDGMRNYIRSYDTEIEALSTETPESLAKMVIMLKGQLMNKEMKRNEVCNSLKVCHAENVKLNVNKRQLLERINSLRSDENKEN